MEDSAKEYASPPAKDIESNNPSSNFETSRCKYAAIEAKHVRFNHRHRAGMKDLKSIEDLMTGVISPPART